MPDVPNPTNPTVADLLPPKARSVVYALLLPANAAAAAVIVAAEGTAAKVVAIATAVVNACGFTLARGNTPR